LPGSATAFCGAGCEWAAVRSERAEPAEAGSFRSSVCPYLQEAAWDIALLLLK